MGLPRIKIGPIWRCAILLALSVLLHGCVHYKANVTEGSFDVNTPKPFWGPGTFIESKKLHVRGTMSYNIEDKENIPLKYVDNYGYKYKVNDKYYELLPQEKADIQYVMKNNPLGGSIDIFYKRMYFTGGGRIAYDHYPSLTIFGGYNSLRWEVGSAIYLGYSKDNASYSGKYGYQGKIGIGTFCWEDSSYTNNFEGKGSYSNVNLGLYIYGGVFPVNKVSFNFSVGFYQPWLFRRYIYIEDAAIPHDYNITFYFPFFLSHYVGATYTLLDHIQLSAGEAVYYTPYSDKLHWQTNISISYLF